MVTAATIAMSVFTGAALSTYTGFRITRGTCPVYEPIKDFDVEAFKGVWYTMQADKLF